MLTKNITALFFMITMASAMAAPMTGQIVISNSYIPAAPPVVKVMAAYMKIENRTSQPVTIKSFSSATFGLIELHETIEKDGMMTMIQIPMLTIAPATTIEFKPGAKHLMLFQRKRNLNSGDKVLITAHTSAGNYSTTVVVKAASGNEHEHHHHH